MPKIVTHSSSVDIGLLLPIASAGLMFHWAGVYVGIYFSTTFSSFADPENAISKVSCLAGIALGLFVIQFFSDKIKDTRHRMYLGLIGTLLSSICNVSILLQYFYLYIPDYLSAILWLGFGAGSSCGLMAWLDLFSCAEHKSFKGAIIVGVLLGGLLCLGAVSLSPLPLVVLMILFPLVSFLILLFFWSRAHFPDPVAAKQSIQRFKPSASSSVVTSIYGAVFGISQYMIFSMPLFATSHVIIGAAVVLGGFALLLATLIFKRASNHLAVQRVLLPIMVVFLLMIPFNEGLIEIVCWALLMAALTCYDISNMAVLAQIANTHKLSSFYFITRGRLPIQLGMFLGWLVGFFFVSNQIINTDMMTVVVLALVVALVVVTTAIPYEKSALKTLSTDHNQTEEHTTLGSWQLRCKAVGIKYDLSARQQDVLVFLAKGRNADYIQRELTVSSHTAKSHIYQIYRKLGVHSQQELIDLIEQTKVEH